MIDIREVCEIFAEELKERMDDVGLRPYHLLSLCKFDDENLQPYLEGKKLPGLYNLVLLAEHLECTVNELLGYPEFGDASLYERFLASDMYFTESQYARCLADRVRHYLDSGCMSFTDLEKHSGFKAPTIRRWFSSTKPHLPTTAKFLQLCETINCTPSELLGY